MFGLEYTDDMDRFIDHRVTEQGMRYEDIADAFNLAFGTSQNWKSIAQHGCRIGSRHMRYLTEEQKQWIKDHFYMEGHSMVAAFNSRFHQNRSYRFIRNQRQKLHAHRNRRREE